MLTIAHYLDRLIESYGENFILLESIAAINDAFLGDAIPYLQQVFKEGPFSPVGLQERLLDLYKELGDVQYLQAYNEIAIRAQRMNKFKEIFPISATYPRFEEALKENGLTLSGLAMERNNLLNILVKT
ncbi:hypothetical protein HYV89_02630 [Candidatus Woesearchaeota archaeon]|nr:hypothetical protein [Candidatus Woesearchaeota archaeon]